MTLCCWLGRNGGAAQTAVSEGLLCCPHLGSHALLPCCRGMWNIAHNMGGFLAPILAGTAAKARALPWESRERLLSIATFTRKGCMAAFRQQ